MGTSKYAEWAEVPTCPCGQVMTECAGYFMGGASDFVAFRCPREHDGCPHSERISIFRNGARVATKFAGPGSIDVVSQRGIPPTDTTEDDLLRRTIEEGAARLNARLNKLRGL